MILSRQSNERKSTRKLKAAKNLRYKNIRVCATCDLCQVDRGAVYCDREDGLDEDIDDMKHWIMVCDRWRKE